MIIPMNGYLCVEPCEDKREAEEHVILVPDDVKIETSAFKLVKLLRPHLDSPLESGACLLVPSHVVELVDVNHCNYYLVHERHVVGLFSEE